MNYALWTTATPRERVFPTFAEALAAAGQDMYISPHDCINMEERLKQGRAARAAYGFSQLEITIRR